MTDPRTDTSTSPTSTAVPAPVDAEQSDVLPTGLVDVAVIGGGSAGLNGALMLGRSRRSVVVIDGDLRFEIVLEGGGRLTTRRVLVATGVRDELPAVPGLAAHWGHGLIHCPYCHGWEVRDQAIGILASGPGSVHQALLFRQLSDDVLYFRRGTELDEEGRARLEALGVRIIEDEVTEVVAAGDGTLAAVRLTDGTQVPRHTLAVASRPLPRLEGLEGLGLEVEELPGGIAAKVPSGMGGVTGVPGVSVGGNVTDPMAQVGASAASGASAGAFLNASLVMAEADAAVAALSGAGAR
ncbi:NAD(P)/FAD-dependent oxidoreductase [Brachybacterium squillarum]|uniref:NAD(P)/FAD-dependent oxidoreductase n=1 Tax=Brachybacterium squillarum TaxID=661979 RepID=UPI0002629B0A|nr:NAD(P)/FAD-dependent oxidoreductase [Brachybacterium squillarum]